MDKFSCQMDSKTTDDQGINDSSKTKKKFTDYLFTKKNEKAQCQVTAQLKKISTQEVPEGSKSEDLSLKKIPPRSLQRTISGLFCHTDVQQATETSLEATSSSRSFELELSIDESDGAEETESIDLKSDKTSNYPHVLQELKGHTGYPWKEIAEISNPILQEQLIDLYHLCKTKAPDLYPRILSATENALKRQEHDLSPESYVHSPSCEFLAKLIYLIDQTEELENFSGKGINLFISVEECFDEQIRKTYKDLIVMYQRFDQTHVFPTEQAVEAQIPIVISKLLITKSGALNTGLINPLIASFTENNEFKFSHFAKALKRAQRDLVARPDLRSQIREVQKPIDNEAIGVAIIRATLSLSPSEPITQADASRTVLASYLSYIRQQMGSETAFADFIMIDSLMYKTEKCLKDLSSLIEKGLITRRSNRKEVSYPSLLDEKKGEYLKRVKFDRDGYLYEGPTRLKQIWQEPGFRNAAAVLGVTNTKEYFKNILEKLRNEATQTNERWTVTVDQVLHKMVEESDSQLLKQTVYLAFTSQIHHPLINTWRHTIANMSQTEYLKNTCQTMLEVIKTALKNSSIDSQNVESKIEKEIESRIKILYSKKDSNEGGFVLYDTKNECAHKNWTALNTPETISTFFEDVISKSVSKEQIGISELKQLSKECAEKTLNNYCSLHGDDLSPLGSFCREKSIPFINTSGTDGVEAYKVYYEIGNKKEIFKSTSQTPEELLYTLLKIGEKHQAKTFDPIPAFISQHQAICIKANSPFFKKVYEVQEHSREWLENTLIEPGRAVAMHTVTESLKDKLVNFVSKKIKLETQATSFLQRAGDIPTDSIAEFRDGLIELYGEMISADPQQKLRIATKIDKEICRSLPENLRKEMLKTALPFAETNWDDHGRDIRLGFMVNPGTGNLELFEMTEDFMEIKPLDLQLWLKGREWQFLPR